jgi:GNAT superfamily N-acetyltransferase
VSREGKPGHDRVRLARAEDVAQLPAIERAAAENFRDLGLAELFSEVLSCIEDLKEACTEGRLWVATDAHDRPVGFALASRVGENAHLDELDVHPDHGRQGLGRALVHAVIEWARAARAPGITLTTLDDVAWNAPFYESLGFRVLAPGERGPDLDELLRQEAARGLPMQHRVAMQLEL